MSARVYRRHLVEECEESVDEGLVAHGVAVVEVLSDPGLTHVEHPAVDGSLRLIPPGREDFVALVLGQRHPKSDFTPPPARTSYQPREERAQRSEDRKNGEVVLWCCCVPRHQERKEVVRRDERPIGQQEHVHQRGVCVAGYVAWEEDGRIHISQSNVPTPIVRHRKRDGGAPEYRACVSRSTSFSKVAYLTTTRPSRCSRTRLLGSSRPAIKCARVYRFVL